MPADPRSPHELAIDPSKLQDDIGELLEAAGVSQHYCDEIMKLVEEAELARAEAQWERQQEHLMEATLHLATPDPRRSV